MPDDLDSLTAIPAVLPDADRPPSAGRLPDEPRPVFVVSGFRTSSTWLRKKLRSAETTMAFTEIFHEFLASLDATQVRAIDPKAWESRHPDSAPYFLEYLPLIGDGQGVPGYASEMAFHRFIPADGIDGHLSDGERAHIAQLIGCARRARRVPVLTCTRLLGRTRALSKAFECRVVLLCRNLFHQWASFSSQAAGGNSYFFVALRECLVHSRHDPFLRALADWYPMAELSPTDERAFQLFVLFHLYLYAFAYDAADLIVDVTALETDDRLRRDVEATLSAWVMAPIDLSVVEPRFELSLIDATSPDISIDTINQFTKLIVAACPTPASAAFVEAAKDAALAEWARHEFYTRRMRRWHESSNRAQEAKLAEIAASKDSAQAALGQVTSDRDTLAIALATTQHAAADAAAERDTLALQLAELRSSCDTLQARLLRACDERDSLRLTAAGQTSAFAVARQGESEAVAARDALAGQVAELTASSEDLRASLAQACAERDTHHATTTEQAAALDAARQAADEVTAERDALLAQRAEMEARSAAKPSRLRRLLARGA